MSKDEVIIAGFGHFGSTIGRFLKANGVTATILDHDSDRVQLLRKMGFKVYYGDATRIDLLQSAGAENAMILVAAIDSPEINQDLIRTVQKHFPHIQVYARARNRVDAYELIDMGIKEIYRENLHTSVKLAVDVLTHMGYRSYTSTRQGLNFIKYDEETLVGMAMHRHNLKEYVIKARETFRIQEELLSTDLEHHAVETDNAWDSVRIRDTLGKIDDDLTPEQASGNHT